MDSNPPAKADKRHFLSEWQFYATGALLLLTYLPVVWFTYGFSDDYSYLYQALIDNKSTLLYNISLGRPIAGLLTNLVFSFVHSIDQMRYVRFLSVLGIGIAGSMLYSVFRSFSIPRSFSFYSALLLFLTPSFQLLSGWAVTFVYPYAVILVIAAIGVSSRGWKIKGVLLQTLLLTFSFWIYQPAGAYYWVLVGSIFLFQVRESNKINIRDLLRLILPWFLAAGIAYFFLIIGNQLMSGAVERANLVNDYYGKISWFIKEPLLMSLNLFTISDSRIYAALIGIFIIAGLYLYFMGTFPRRTVFILGSLALIPLSYSPYLLSIENWASYRGQLALSGMCIVLFLYALLGIHKKIKLNHTLVNAFMMILVFACSVNATRVIITSIAIPQEIELRYLENIISTADFEDITEIQVIRSDWTDSLDKAVYDEFGLPSTTPQWVPEPMTRLALLKYAPGYADLPITVLPPETEPTKKEEGQTLTINMHNIRYFQ